MLDASVSPPLGTFLVAWLDGEAVGCGGLRPAPTGDLGVAEIKRMYVAPSVRSEGVGRCIVEALEEQARALGVSRVVLETGTRQDAAIALYEKMGFARIPAFGEYAESPVAICMEKRLA